MNYATLINRMQVLPEGKQLEVFDFVEFLAVRFASSSQTSMAEWSEGGFSTLAMTQAMRGIEDEPTLYTEADLAERWQ